MVNEENHIDREVSLRDVLDTVAGVILIVFVFVTIISLIWTVWPLFRVSCTVIVVDLAWTALRWGWDGLKKAGK